MDRLKFRLPLDFTKDPLVKQHFSGEIRQDETTRLLYSTDASIYQIEPLGVAFPRNKDDLQILIETSSKYKLPILPRGSGSSLAGQAIGEALIIDCSRYLNHIVEVNPENQTATVEPGLILSALNRAISPHQLQFGPDPASAERATIGGCVGNNAAGAHSIIYGMTADHLVAVDVIFADGSQGTLAETSLRNAELLAESSKSIESQIYQTALDIRKNYQGEIQKRWPKTWRRASGYNLNYLIPWSPTTPPQWYSNAEWFNYDDAETIPYPPVAPGNINLAPLIAASEGSLSVISTATLKLVKKPRITILAVLSYSNLIEACLNVESILEHQPSAVELIPRNLISLARSVPAYASLTSVVDHFHIGGVDPEALLVVEFSGNDQATLLNKAKKMGKDAWIVETAEAQKKIWDIRKVGLGILMSRPGAHKPVAFIEDTAVPVNHLGEFVSEIQKILDDHKTTAEFYAHASAGCLHIRPILNLKSPQGVTDLRAIAEQTVALTIRLGGAVSAEHGDGFARGEWLQTTYGDKIIQAFTKLKSAADPNGLLNPGKIVQPPKMDTNLRYGSDYRSEGWSPTFLFRTGGKNTNLVDAIEQCNGAGVCRKVDGVMCPSFQASQEEMHSTRGRANLLRALISGKFPSQSAGNQAVREALDLCLACKGCKSECPSGVDIARLKYEFFQNYYDKQGFRHPIRDYLFGYIGYLAAIGHIFAPMLNYLLGTKVMRVLGEKLLGLTSQRALPKFSFQSLESSWRNSKRQANSEAAMPENVLFLSDAFTEFFQPEIGIAALEVLKRIGCNVHIIPTKGAGRTLISKGFLSSARNHILRLISDIKVLDPNGRMPIIGIEPSEIYTLRDEFLDFFPDDPLIKNISCHSYLLDEFLIRPDEMGNIRLRKLSFNNKEFHKEVLFHGHCYQKAQTPSADGFATGVPASLQLLKSAGYSVQFVESGCCGMAGAFGYEREHYGFSQRVAEHTLFPEIRKAREADPNVILCTPGISCRSQIEDGIGISPYHPIQLIVNRL